MPEGDKHIDESWKDSVEKQKEKECGCHEGHHEEHKIPEASFSFFITTLGIQIAIALGEVANPVTNKQEENLDQAQYLIDTLEMLQEKTKNNLTKEEEQELSGFLYEFRMKFSAKKSGLKI